MYFWTSSEHHSATFYEAQATILNKKNLYGPKDPTTRPSRIENHPTKHPQRPYIFSASINSICQSSFRGKGRRSDSLREKRNIVTASIPVIIIITLFSFFKCLLKFYKIEILSFLFKKNPWKFEEASMAPFFANKQKLRFGGSSQLL